jgi:hypothetical protein
MAILFKTAISEDKAQQKIEAAILGGHCDGYLNVVTEYGERAEAWQRGQHASEFRDHVEKALDDAKRNAPFWIVYERSHRDNDASANDIRNAAIRLTRGYSGTIVVALSLLSHHDDDGDLELVLVCFQEDFHRRNFRVRYENKYIPD